MVAGGTIRGTITVDGYPKDQATFNRVSGYVEQVSPSSGIHYMHTHITSHTRYQCHIPKPTDTRHARLYPNKIVSLVISYLPL